MCSVCDRPYGNMSEYEHSQSKQHKVSELLLIIMMMMVVVVTVAVD